MDALTSKRLRAWMLRHSQRLAEHAIEAVETTDALHKGVQYHDDFRGKWTVDITSSQLQALLNTAHACSAADTVTFVRQRAERRQKVGKQDEAAFWEALDHRLRDLERSFVQEALADAASPDDEATPDPDTERQVQTLVTRAYLNHFVAHCQYLQGQTL